MFRFSLFGIPVRVEPWFWLVMVLIGGGIGARTREEILGVALFALAGFLSVLTHELGHALAGRLFGARSSITLHAMGGLAEFPGAWFTRGQSFVVTFAGPAVQILLGVAVFLAIPDLGRLQSLAGHFWWALAWISVVWAVLNLVPVLPLDGGQMLHAVLGPQRVRVTLWVSILCAVGLGAAAWMQFKLLLFPILLGYFAYQSWRRLQDLSA